MITRSIKNNTLTAKEIIIKKYGTKNFIPMWLTLEIKEIVWLMKEYHKQQLKKLNLSDGH